MICPFCKSERLRLSFSEEDRDYYFCLECGETFEDEDDDDLREDFPYGYDALDARRSHERPLTRGEQ